jgi:DNA-binding response OmpR family regulator
VEDDRLVQLAVREYLSRSGYRVLQARDGHEAVQVAREHSEPIPLVVSDMVLPGMSGSEVARAVAEIHPESKVIYMSAHSHDMLIEAGHLQADEETETLQKPFDEEEFLARVHEVLEPPSPAHR